METVKLSHAKRLNKEAGLYFWSKATKKHFNHRDETGMLKGNYFICSSVYIASNGEELKSFKLNKFNPETAQVDFIQSFKTLEQAKNFYKSILK